MRARVAHIECVAATAAGVPSRLHSLADLPAGLQTGVCEAFEAAAATVRQAEPDAGLSAVPEPPVIDPTQGLAFFDTISLTSLLRTAPTLIAVPEAIHPGVAEL